MKHGRAPFGCHPVHPRASVIIDDNNATLRECRIAAHSAFVSSGETPIGRSTRRWTSSTSISTNTDASSVLPEYSTRQSTLKKLVTAPTLRTFSLTWHCRRLQLKRSKGTGFQHRSSAPVSNTGCIISFKGRSLKRGVSAYVGLASCERCIRHGIRDFPTFG